MQLLTAEFSVHLTAQSSRKSPAPSRGTDGSHHIASSRRSFRQSNFLWIPKRIHWIKKRWVDRIRRVCVCWNLGFQLEAKKILGFEQSLLKNEFLELKAKSLSTHVLWSASFPAFQQKERASENKDTYLPRDREQVHQFLLNGNWTSKEEVGGGGWVGGCEARCWKSNWLTTWRSTWAIMSRDSLRKLSKLASGKVCMCTHSLES